MSETRRMAIYGIHPPCAQRSRLEERRTKARNLRLEKARKTEKPEDFVCYDDSDDEEESLCSQRKVLNSSYNFVDYVRSREQGLKEYRTCKREYTTRHILTHDMFKERSVSLNTMNKVFCSQWLSDRQVVFGTKCNKLMVYDVVRDKLDQIPSLRGRTEPSAEAGVGGEQSGIHALQINPSRTLLATGAHSSNEVAFYQLPTLDPVCIGEGAHRDWVFDMVWMDDQFLVTGSRDTRLALWRVRSEGSGESVSCDSGGGGTVGGEKALLPTYSHISALEVRECKAAQKIRALAFNRHNRELAALSLNGYIHLWNAETFKQKLSRKLPSCQENVCMAVEETGKLYAIGCRSHTLLLDPRTLQATKKIQSRFSGCGIRSTSFQGNILTIGTGVGLILFYDLRAGKYLESSINASRTAVLKTSRGYVVPDEEFMDGMNALTKYTPAIYTHCYDFSGTRLFSAGGPLPASVYGNYAGIWH